MKFTGSSDRVTDLRDAPDFGDNMMCKSQPIASAWRRSVAIDGACLRLPTLDPNCATEACAMPMLVAMSAWLVSASWRARTGSPSAANSSPGASQALANAGSFD